MLTGIQRNRRASVIVCNSSCMQRGRRTQQVNNQSGPAREQRRQRRSGHPSSNRVSRRSQQPRRRSARLNPASEIPEIENQFTVAPPSGQQNAPAVNQSEIPNPNAPHLQTPDNLADNIPEITNNMGSDRVYSVEIAVQPPSVAKTGVPLYPPAVVRVHTYDSDGNEITGEDEMSSMFAQATLWRESGNPPSLAPPDMYLLSGRLSMSLDLLNDAIATEGCNGVSPSTALHRQQGSYAMFPDLTINRPGRYKLGISVFKVGDGSRVRSSISAGSSDGASRGGGVSLEEAKSIVISVEDDALPSSRPDSAARAFLEHLRTRGANVPSPPSYM